MRYTVMSAAATQAVMDRLAGRLEPMTHEQGRAYLFLAFAILANQAPEVVAFILDRADEQVQL